VPTDPEWDTFLVTIKEGPGFDPVSVLREINAQRDLVLKAELIDAYEPRNLIVVRLRHSQSDARGLRTLRGVERVEPNYSFKSQSKPAPTPNDQDFPRQWNLHCTAGPNCLVDDVDLNAPEAWSELSWQPGQPMPDFAVTIAVMDTGVDLTHPDLNGRVSPDHRVSFLGPTPTEDVNDENGHGTAMSGVIAALGNNSTDVAGLMWATTIIPCRMAAGDIGDLVATIRCVRWISHLADGGTAIAAVNFSFGTTEGCACALENEIRGLRERGILFVTATSEDNTATNDAVVSGQCPVFPAANRVSNIIAVTASDQNDSVVAGGGKRSVHVAAPGRRSQCCGCRAEENHSGYFPSGGAGHGIDRALESARSLSRLAYAA